MVALARTAARQGNTMKKLMLLIALAFAIVTWAAVALTIHTQRAIADSGPRQLLSQIRRHQGEVRRIAESAYAGCWYNILTGEDVSLEQIGPLGSQLAQDGRHATAKGPQGKTITYLGRGLHWENAETGERVASRTLGPFGSQLADDGYHAIAAGPRGPVVTYLRVKCTAPGFSM